MAQGAIDRRQHRGKPCRAAARDALEGDAGPCERGADQLVDRLAHLRAVALQAIGTPGQVECRDERQVDAGLFLIGERVEAPIAEDELAVDGDHQRGRVGHDDLGGGRGRLDAARLFAGDVHLLVATRRALVLDAELAQHLVHHGDLQAAPSKHGPGIGGQRRLAGAFGAEQRDDEGAAHAAMRSCCQARQPATDMTANTA